MIFDIWKNPLVLLKLLLCEFYLCHYKFRPPRIRLRNVLLSQCVRRIDYEKTSFLWFFVLCSETARGMGWELK